MAGKHWLDTISLLSGGAVRRNSLRCAPFDPPTVSCVLAPARTCLRQAPPTSRGRGLATSAVPHHLTDDMAIKTLNLEKRCKKTSFFSPFQKIQTNGVKSGRFLHRLVRSCGCLGQASGQVLHGHFHDSYRITLKISHLKRWQYEKRVYHNAQIERFTPATDNCSRGDFFKKRSFDTPSFYYMRSLQALAAYELTHDGCRRDCGDFFRRQGHDVIQELEQADGLGICG